MPIDLKMERAVSAHLDYLRDLGIFDIYRRNLHDRHGPLLSGNSEADSDPASLASNADRQAAASAIIPSSSQQSSSHQSSSHQELIIPSRPPVAMPPPAGPALSPADKASALLAIRADIGDCARCALSAGRNKIVFGDGDPNARLMFVGEGPGADEDAQGLPFVGRAGQLLNNMIAAMQMRRDQVYIANIVKCRPPQNRVPEPQEANTCSAFLFRQIDVIRPQVLVALGSTAALYLLGIKSPLSALRGRVHECSGTKLIVTYHPAYLLRDPRQKKEAWRDLQLAMSELGLKAAPR